MHHKSPIRESLNKDQDWLTISMDHVLRRSLCSEHSLAKYLGALGGCWFLLWWFFKWQGKGGQPDSINSCVLHAGHDNDMWTKSYNFHANHTITM